MTAGRSLPELADAHGLSLTLLEALAREGLLLPSEPGRFSDEDLDTVKAGMQLVEAGLPLSELLHLAREAARTLEDLAESAVDLFFRYVRDAAYADADEQSAAEQVAAAVAAMLPATSALVGQHFRRLVVKAADARLS